MVWITCGLLWCFYQLFGLSFWRHPFTAEDPLVSKWWNATFLQIWWRNKLKYIQRFPPFVPNQSGFRSNDKPVIYNNPTCTKRKLNDRLSHQGLCTRSHLRAVKQHLCEECKSGTHSHISFPAKRPIPSYFYGSTFLYHRIKSCIWMYLRLPHAWLTSAAACTNVW